MAIPKIEIFLYRLKDMYNVGIKDRNKAIIIEQFHLSKEVCKLRTTDGSINRLNDRLGCSRQRFRLALFIEIPQRCINKIIKQRQAKRYNKYHWQTTNSTAWGVLAGQAIPHS